MSACQTQIAQDSMGAANATRFIVTECALAEPADVIASLLAGPN